jgi:hypothetical protein
MVSITALSRDQIQTLVDDFFFSHRPVRNLAAAVFSGLHLAASARPVSGMDRVYLLLVLVSLISCIVALGCSSVFFFFFF